MKISSNYKFACILYKRAKFHHILKKLCLNYKNQLVNSVIWCFSDRASLYALVSSYQLNAQFLYSITIYMLHYNPRHVSSSTLLILRRTNCIITASGIVTLCKRHMVRPFTESDDTRGCNNTICPPEDEQGTARNLSRIIM